MNINKEKQEVIQAGKELLEKLYEVQEKMNDASSWGMFDLLGGGFFSGLAKHEKIDEAKAMLPECNAFLDKFASELQDLHQDYHIRIEIDEEDKTWDLIFDNVFTDWSVQDKIDKTVSDIQDIIDDVENIIKQMEEE